MTEKLKLPLCNATKKDGEPCTLPATKGKVCHLHNRYKNKPKKAKTVGQKVTEITAPKMSEMREVLSDVFVENVSFLRKVRDGEIMDSVNTATGEIEDKEADVRVRVEAVKELRAHAQFFEKVEEVEPDDEEKLRAAILRKMSG